MKKIYEIKASGEGLPATMKDYLRRMGLSATLIKETKYGGIHLNGEAVTVRATVKEYDLIEIYQKEKTSEGIPPMDIPLKVLYEDEWFIAVDKPTNMPTHPSKGNNLPTLANAVMGYFKGDFVFRSVNRLDRDTSGIVIIAKNQMAAGVLSSDMKKGLWQKSYHAVVDGVPDPRCGVIDAPIERIADGNIKRAVREDGKRAITEYTVIEEHGDYSICRIRLLTGRTHQIRVHFAHIGHPLSSDYLYGSPSEREYSLRCVNLKLPHPKTREIIEIEC